MININEYLINRKTKEKGLKADDRVLLVDLSFADVYISVQFIEAVYDENTISLMEYQGETKYTKQHINIDEMQPDYVYMKDKRTKFIFVGNNAYNLLKRQIDNPNSKFYGGKALDSERLTPKEYCEGLIAWFQ